jgi:hypothetical protein
MYNDNKIHMNPIYRAKWSSKYWWKK